MMMNVKPTIRMTWIALFLTLLCFAAPLQASDQSDAAPNVVYYTPTGTDNIGSIALRFGVGIGEVRSWNKLEGYDIEPGSRLIVKSPEKVERENKDPLPVIHRVKSGDTFESIAKKYGVSIKQVRRWNRKIHPRRIQIGQRIRLHIPGRGGRSVAWGSANRGRLYNGVAMQTVTGMRVRNVARAYGTERVIKLLEAAAYDVKARWSDAPDLEIADISYRSGGRMRPHKSHQNGRDADLSYYHRGNVETGLRAVDPETFDAAKNWHIFKTLIDTGEVEFIFVEHGLQKLLFEYATHLGYSPEDLEPILQYPRAKNVSAGIIRHSRGHDDHWHIRFKCGPEDKGCR